MLEQIKAIVAKTDSSNDIQNYLHQVGTMIIKYTELEAELNDAYFAEKSFDELKAQNHEMFSELIGDNYNTSYANPKYSVSTFGKDLGQLLAAVYSNFRSIRKYAFQHNTEAINALSAFCVKISDYMLNNEVQYDELKSLYRAFKSDTIETLMMAPLAARFIKEKNYNHTIATNSDLTDLRYLFKYGVHITDNEIKTAEFLLTYDEENLKELTKLTANAYAKGFITDGKDITLRNDVRTIFNVGQERMVKSLFEYFKPHTVNGFYSEPESTSANKQYDYDHKFDNALYLDEDFAELQKSEVNKVLEANKAAFNDYSGIMVYERFGETPFSPESKPENLKLSEEQTKMSQGIQMNLRQKLEEYCPESETSFCIIAFPVPEIGEKFEEIYAETCKINMLDSNIYEPIHKTIIDALDQGDYVHVKGKDGNLTDIKVKMKDLENPEKQTNYVNCTADVNIPVGEVFTSPVLKGTNGLLHLDVVFLDELEYKELKLTFEDGNVTEYTCKNFENEDENKKYIEENLLFPHKSLPLGEFAIGTNTLAYVTAEKYDIVDILPILIVEKMGPHFAIGDTCFSWAEDVPVFNPDGKEIVARENERSILRHEDISKAYTNCHTDITLPYDSLDFIKAVTKTGQDIDIIRDGRFVLPGTEKLNEPFNK